MSGIFGAIGVSDSDRVFKATAGQRVIYEAAARFVAERNAELDAAYAVFVQGETEDYKLRYKLPGGGYLQRRGRAGRPGAVKATGQWDVAFPLEDFADAIAIDDVTMAYMTVGELDRHLQTVVARNINTVRFEMIKALVNNTADTFVDELWGSLTIQPLCNTDGTLYPPVLGSNTEADDEHYIISGYTSANISDANNPFPTLRAELEEHFGAPTGGANVAVFINQGQTTKCRALSNFVELPATAIQVGANTAVPQAVPPELMRFGQVLGWCDGCWVIEWRWITAEFALAIHLDAEKPLMKRVDPADTGLGRGLQLVTRETEFPFEESFWRHRFGYGCANRLNGVVMEFDTVGYTIPTGYS